MRIAVIALTLAAVSAGAAVAAERVSDVDYLKASRCKGLASSDLNAVDAAALDAFVKEQSRARTAFVVQKGVDEETRAKREVKSGKAERRARLTAELSGPCQAFKS